PDVEPRRGLVEEQEHRRGQERACDGDLLLHATRELLERLVDAPGIDPETAEDRVDPGARGLGADAVEPARVHEVLHRGELLEERRLHGDAVDVPLDGELVGADVESEYADLARVGGQQRREHPDERGLPRAVRTEEAVDLAAVNAQADPVDRAHMAGGRGATPPGSEDLPYVARLERRRGVGASAPAMTRARLHYR